MPEHVLLSGATGFVGGALLRALRADGVRVTCLTRRPVAAPHVLADLEHVVPPLPRDVDAVVHCAASVRFDLPLADQRRINVDGTRRLLGRAAELPRLDRVLHVSTAYCGGATHRNAYEQTKAEAEDAVRASGLPVLVARPSIVVGDARTGWTQSFNVLYQPLRAFARGLIREVPGRPDGVVDVVPVDHVVAGLQVLLGHDELHGTHQLVAGPRASTVGELVALAARAYGRPAPPFGDGSDLGALLPYFSVEDRFDDPATRALLRAHGIEVPPLREYFDRLVAFAERTRWGRRPQPAAA